jgi:hypothetical protein
VSTREKEREALQAMLDHESEQHQRALALLDAAQKEAVELRTLLAGVPGSTLAEQITTLLADRARVDWLEAWLKEDDPTRFVEAWRTSGRNDIWLYMLADFPDGYGPHTVAEEATLRAAIDVAMTKSME